jgi:hypothetical protein
MRTFAVESKTCPDAHFTKKPRRFQLKPLQNLAPSSSSLKIVKSPSKIEKPQSLNRQNKNRSPKYPTRRSKLTAAQVHQVSAIISPVTPLNRSAQSQKKLNLPLVGEFSEGNTSFASVIFGEHEQVGLSKIGRANEQIRMWEHVLVERKRAQPSLVPVVEQKLREATEIRTMMSESLEGNYRVG